MSITNLKIRKGEVLNDDASTEDILEYQLKELEFDFALPRWAYTSEEWGDYTIKKIALQRRLRNLQALMSYNTSAVE